jgi:hypothetical protein
MRIPQDMLEDLIENEGETGTGPINNLGILRLALDLQEAREEIAKLKECNKDMAKKIAKVGEEARKQIAILDKSIARMDNCTKNLTMPEKEKRK